MKYRRDIAATPQRSARTTWTRIIELITAEGSIKTEQLEAARSVMEAVIAEEHPTNSPIVVSGSGPRLVIYLRYDAEALALGDQVEALGWNPTEGDWAISAPADGDDMKWMNETLKERAPSIKVRDRDQALAEGSDDKSHQELSINWEILG